jgi:hypothetical protein
MSKTEHLKKAGMARRENKIKNLFSKFFSEFPDFLPARRFVWRERKISFFFFFVFRL